MAIHKRRQTRILKILSIGNPTEKATCMVCSWVLTKEALPLIIQLTTYTFHRWLTKCMFIFILWQWLTKYKNDTSYLIVQTQIFYCSPLTHRMYFLFWLNNDSLHKVLCKYSMYAISSGLPMNIHFWWMMGYIFSTVENLLMIDKLANESASVV